MSRCGKLSVCLLALVSASCATPPNGLDQYVVAFDPNEPFGLISGYVATHRVRGLPACPDDFICMDAVFEIQLDRAELVAGSADSRISTVWAVWHTGVGGSPQMAFIVQKAEDGRLWSVGRGARVSDGRACFGDWAWQSHRELLMTAGGELVDDTVCVRVS